MQPARDAPARVAWIVWAALLASTGVYAAVGILLGPAGMADPALVALLGRILGALGLATVGASVLLRPALARALPYGSYLTLRWVLCEAVALFGLVLRLLGAGVDVLAGFVAFGALGVVVAAPTAAEARRYRELRGGWS